MFAGFVLFMFSGGLRNSFWILKILLTRFFYRRSWDALLFNSDCVVLQGHLYSIISLICLTVPLKTIDTIFFHFIPHCPHQCCRAGAGTLCPEPVWRSDSVYGSSWDEKEKNSERYSLPSLEHWLKVNSKIKSFFSEEGGVLLTIIC